MTALAERLLARHYASRPHPYKLFESAVESHLSPELVLLDAGCGRSAPVLRKFLGRAHRLIGVELVEFTDVPEGIETHNTDLRSATTARRECRRDHVPQRVRAPGRPTKRSTASSPESSGQVGESSS